MLENVGRKVALIVILLLVSLGLIFIPKQPFRLGLDLQGGTRIVYRFDFEGARTRGELSANENTADILAQTVTILRERVDPSGTREVSVRTEGTDRVVIELPGNSALEGTTPVETKLGADLEATSAETGTIVLADGSAFSNTGVIQVGEEQIRFGRRSGNTLYDLKRANNGKTAVHKSGDAVRLVNSDTIRDAIENLGDLSFMIVAEDRDFSEKDTDLQTETQRLQAWQETRPGENVTGFNQVPHDKGGPDPMIRWYPTRFGDNAGAPMAVLVPKSASETFRGDALQRVFPSNDQYGYPAVGFEMRPERLDDFADFTGGNVNRRMAILLNDEIRSAPNLMTKLVGSSIIEGRFKDQEVKNLITVLRSGSLKLKPTLEHDERVGATLGDDYVNRGLYSSLLALAIVISFMIIYYRRLGMFSALALLTNLVMFMGGLAFLQATLTLPGIAGIVLTVGMAVDSNILIFDRLREEAEKGRNPKQAAKAGFEGAMSAIIDSNICTFLSAVILYKVGTGPVRGFAVTLMVGILTSVFAALVTTRVFVNWALSRGTERFKMGRWMADVRLDYLSKTKYFVAGSLLICLGGLGVFLSLPDEEKLGIDFTGGVEAQLETAKPESIDTVRARVAAIPDIGASAEVKPVLNAAAGNGEYTQFRVSFKRTGTDVTEGKEQRTKIQTELKDLLLDNPIEIAQRPEGDAAKVDINILFQKGPAEAEVKTALEAAGLKDVTVAVGGRVGSFKTSGTTAAGRAPSDLESAVRDAFRALPDGAELIFATSIPSFSQVGPQVVGELRDNALLAIALSLFITVIYIRVRFAEYSYGIAAMVALVHDVLVTLAALAIGNHFGIVNGEIGLAQIAVFLTIIGYSVNDTIVIFDRVRENLPKTKLPLRDVLNQSINETMSRTIMTSMTVFMAIVVQYLFNMGTGNTLESISYAMIFGTISGVYSTIYIANPIFLWLETRSQNSKGSGGAQARAQREADKARERKARLEEAEGGDEGMQAEQA